MQKCFIYARRRSHYGEPDYNVSTGEYGCCDCFDENNQRHSAQGLMCSQAVDDSACKSLMGENGQAIETSNSRGSEKASKRQGKVCGCAPGFGWGGVLSDQSKCSLPTTHTCTADNEIPFETAHNDHNEYGYCNCVRTHSWNGERCVCDSDNVACIQDTKIDESTGQYVLPYIC